MLKLKLDMAYAMINKNQTSLSLPSWNSSGKCLWYIVKGKSKLKGFGNYNAIVVYLGSVCIEN